MQQCTLEQQTRLSSPLTHAWSRYFYEKEDLYREIDGTIYPNAHNDEDTVPLYERAEDALLCPDERTMRLDKSCCVLSQSLPVTRRSILRRPAGYGP